MNKDRLKGINIGGLVWEEVQRGGDITDFHLAIIKNICANESYIDVIDVSTTGNPEKRYYNFLTAEDMLSRGAKIEDLEKEKAKYKTIINRVIQSTK